MTARRTLRGVLLRWVPFWRLVDVHVVSARQKREERFEIRRNRRALSRLARVGARPRDGPP